MNEEAISYIMQKIADMDFEERECVVLGKGDKERIVYFDAKTKLHLEKYLRSRNDDNPALFVTISRVMLSWHIRNIWDKNSFKYFANALV